MLDFKFFNGEQEHPPFYRSIVRWMWYLAFGAIGGVVLLFLILSFTDLPSVEQLENPKSELASQVFAINGEVIGRYYTENRVPVTFDQLSPHIVNALIATEDERYYKHSGIDFRALGRVVVKTMLLRQKSAGGASTITQQLAKLLFTGKPGSGFERVIQKFKEWIIAVRLERKYTKEEIIAMYLNKFDFLYQGYGIKAASEIYFNKSQDSLQLHEAALLMGMLKNPDLFNPVKRPEEALQRRTVVFKQMEKNNLITGEEYDTLRNLPLGLRFNRRTHIDGIATYFRMELAKDVKEILQREENRKVDGSVYDIYRDGLRIYTTIDPYLQTMAEEVMTGHMAQRQKNLHREWRGMDPWTYRSKSENEISIELRKQTLNRLIRESERYQALREKYLLPHLRPLQQQFDEFTFHDDDREIDRMVAELNRPGYLTDLVDNGIISARLARDYRGVMQSDDFSTLASKWEDFQDQVRESFNRPTSMKVFAYNDKMETDTTLTPLDSIKYHRMFLQTGILAVDPRTGEIKVWIGGINQKYFQFDHVRTNRQVGSTFKPFIYSTAIALQGISPCYEVYDSPQTIAPGEGNFGLLQSWTPSNFTGSYSGNLYTLKEGLARSINTISVHLMKQLGDTEPVRGLVHNMGIDSSARYPNGRYRVPKAPSICLGSTDLTVYEMTGAYTTYANDGIFVRPYFIKRIEDKNGRIIYEAQVEERRALPPNANYVMVEMLRYAATGMGALKSDVGGKTGTTNDFADGWFMGITPNLVVGTWVGGEDKWIHFRSPDFGQGAYMSKPFFRSFLQKVEGAIAQAKKEGRDPGFDYDPEARFVRPPGDLGIVIDCAEYRRDEIQLRKDQFEEDVFSEEIFGEEFNQPRRR